MSPSNNTQEPDRSYQEEAIKDILADFRVNSAGKFLLVLPTGGGKTLTAIRAVDQMIKQGRLSLKKKVIWIVHTKALKRQAEKEIIKPFNVQKFTFHKDLEKILEVRMKDDARQVLTSPKAIEYVLLIIDEAHHSAAASYQPFFRNDIGVLGLTATPSRSDEAQLHFEKESFTISFRELEERRVVVSPVFITIRTGITLGASDLSERNQSSFDIFDRDDRNHLIARTILRNTKKHGFKKVVVFVGNNHHVVSLYEVLKKETELQAIPSFGHIGYIFSGDNNDMGISNEDYLDRHRELSSSILVNCRLLNEGYDDPSIDCVVMATPTNSVLYYVQCVGRVVRTAVSGGLNKAFVIELADNLPNINYRIDNRWLYSEVSDFLEPEVVPLKFRNPLEKRLLIREIIKKYSINERYVNSLLNLDGRESSMLLFRESNDLNSPWLPLSLTGKYRKNYIDFFNTTSNNAEEFFVGDHKTIVQVKFQIPEDDFYFSHRPFRVGVFTALNQAYLLKTAHKKVDNLVYIRFETRSLSFWAYWVYWCISALRLLLTK